MAEEPKFDEETQPEEGTTEEEGKEEEETQKDEDEETEKKTEKPEEEGEAEGEEAEGEVKAAAKPPAKGGRARKLTNQFNFSERAALTYNNPTRVSYFSMFVFCFISLRYFSCFSHIFNDFVAFVSK